MMDLGVQTLDLVMWFLDFPPAASVVSHMHPGEGMEVEDTVAIIVRLHDKPRPPNLVRRPEETLLFGNAEAPRKIATRRCAGNGGLEASAFARASFSSASLSVISASSSRASPE